MDIVKDKIESFKKDLVILEYDELFQKYVVDGESFYFSVIDRKVREYELKILIAKYFDISVREIIIVGSSKMGFSLKPSNLFNEFDFRYKQTSLRKDKSDIDIAIVSPELFRLKLREAFDFTNSYTVKWNYNEYYTKVYADSRFDVSINYKFFEYNSKGWLRPDFKPNGFEFCVNGSYEKLKNDIFKLIGRKIGIGVYSDWYYFRSYHIENIKRLSFQAKTNVI